MASSVPARQPPPPKEESGGWFRKKPVYDRRAILEAASQAQGKGKRKKAIAEYRKVLEMEPDNPTLLVKLAVLLAETKQPEEAWKTFVRSAELYRKDGMTDKWSSVWTQAVLYFPRAPEAWLALAEAKQSKSVAADATATLLGATKHFRRRKDRDGLVTLLRRAFELTPYAHDVTLAYAKALVKTGAKKDAIAMLEELARRSGGRKLRQVRGRLFRLRPTPGAAWRWLRAAFGRR